MKAWMALPEAERRAKEQEGMADWKAWVYQHHPAVAAMGGPLGKTKKITGRIGGNVRSVTSKGYRTCPTPYACTAF
jgi:hypothetical protein